VEEEERILGNEANRMKMNEMKMKKRDFLESLNF